MRAADCSENSDINEVGRWHVASNRPTKEHALPFCNRDVLQTPKNGATVQRSSQKKTAPVFRLATEGRNNCCESDEVAQK